MPGGRRSMSGYSRHDETGMGTGAGPENIYGISIHNVTTNQTLKEKLTLMGIRLLY